MALKKRSGKCFSRSRHFYNLATYQCTITLRRWGRPPRHLLVMTSFPVVIAPRSFVLVLESPVSGVPTSPSPSSTTSTASTTSATPPPPSPTPTTRTFSRLMNLPGSFLLARGLNRSRPISRKFVFLKDLVFPWLLTSTSIRVGFISQLSPALTLRSNITLHPSICSSTQPTRSAMSE